MLLSQPPRNWKKRRELLQFTEFASIQKSASHGTAIQPDPPEPDIVLSGPVGLLGIELTDITLGGEAKGAYEGEQLRAMKTAKKLYKAAANEPFSAWFTWMEEGSLSKRDRHRH